MQGTDYDGLSPQLRVRLRRELDAVDPPATFPRYLSPARALAWRLAPAALAAALVGLLAASGYAETGSANPAVWTERAVNVIRPAGPSSEKDEHQNQVQGRETPESTQAAETSRTSEPSESPEPNESGSHDQGESSDRGDVQPGSDGGGADH